MRWLGLVLLSVAFSACAQSPDQSAVLRSIVERAHAAGSFDGVVVVARSGTVSFVQAVGVADKARQLPIIVDQKCGER